MPDAAPAREVIVSIDQGTTNTKAVLVDRDGQVVAVGSAPVGVTSPAPGWVEQSAEVIWASVLAALADGLGDQTWNDRRASPCRPSASRSSAGRPRPDGHSVRSSAGRTAGRQPGAQPPSAPRPGTTVRRRTGLQVDAMFSGPKIRWMLDHLPAGVASSDVRVGTVDAWLIWNLTGGRLHACDAGNASRTLLLRRRRPGLERGVARACSGCRPPRCPRSGPPTAASGRLWACRASPTERRSWP